jgi:hypothetical protein
VRPHVSRREQGVAQLRVFQNLVRKPWRNITAERLPHDVFAPSDFRLKLHRRDLATYGTSAHKRIDTGPERLVHRHNIPKNLF